MTSTSDSSLVAQLPQITSFDIAPDLSLYATGDDDGNIRIGSLSRAGQPLKAKPHLSSILSLRFFPSSKVVLTTSNDFTLSIMSAQDLSIPRTLKAHTRAVTDSAIISRGKNVLSCAKVNSSDSCRARMLLSEKSVLFLLPRMAQFVYGMWALAPKSMSWVPVAILPCTRCHWEVWSLSYTNLQTAK